jgi:transposase
METRVLLPSSSGLRLEELSYEDDQVLLVVSSARPTGICPVCGQPGSRVHSSYLRTLQVLPWQGSRVAIRWRSRKFFCDSPQLSAAHLHGASPRRDVAVWSSHDAPARRASMSGSGMGGRTWLSGSAASGDAR